jgi:deoxyribonuclease IV
MSLVFGAHVSVSGGVDKAFASGEEFAMEAIQVFTKNERQWRAKPLDDAVVERWYEERARTGIELIVSHASYLINLATPKEDLLEKSFLAFLDELERCETLGIRGLVIHPGAHTGSGEEAGIAAVATALNRAHDALPHLRVQTLLETTAGQGTTLGRTFEELAAIVDQVEAKDRVGICLDTCHIFAAGYEFRTDETYAATMRNFDDTLGIANLKAIHLNDSKFPFASNRDRHEHIGEGEIGLEGFRNLVNDPRLAGIPGLLETEKGDDNAFDGHNLATLRGLVTTTV